MNLKVKVKVGFL